MGIYLATGIVVEMAISKKPRDGGTVALEDVFEKLTQEDHFDLDNYDIIDDEDETLLRLKKHLLAQQLPDFLRAYYGMMYASKEDSGDNGGDVIEAIEGKADDEILALAERKSHYYFQSGGYYDMLYFYDKPFRPRIKVRYTTIVLSSEGKIIMECYGKHFRFFKKCMLSALSQYPLISTVQVYLTE